MTVRSTTKMKLSDEKLEKLSVKMKIFLADNFYNVDKDWEPLFIRATTNHYVAHYDDDDLSIWFFADFNACTYRILYKGKEIETGFIDY